MCCSTVLIRQESKQQVLRTTVEVTPRPRVLDSDTESRLHVGGKGKRASSDRARLPRSLIGVLEFDCRTQVIEVTAALGEDRPDHVTAMGIRSCRGRQPHPASDPRPPATQSGPRHGLSQADQEDIVPNAWQTEALSLMLSEGHCYPHLIGETVEHVPTITVVSTRQ